MPIDDLNRPLGTSAALHSKPAISIKSKAAFIALVGCAAGLAFLWVNDDGTGGRPRAVVQIESASPSGPASAQNYPADLQSGATVKTGNPEERSSRATGQDVENSSGVRVVRQGGGEIPGALIITVPQAPVIGLAPAPDRQLIEKSIHGSLPKIAADGRKAIDVYARPVATSVKLPVTAPRIAIMIGGMGLSQTATRHAMDKLPAAITLAFAPYGAGLTAQVTAAREQGFEVMLQAPMEPFDLAGEGPGPHMLRSSHDRAELKDHLHWLMSRFPGYVGIANFLGAKFLADAKSVAPVIEEIGARGLFIFDDGSATQSLAIKIAAASATPYVQADVIIDAERTGQAIEKALLRLESIAREKGLATGVAAGLPETTDRIAAFARGLERRGIALVPVSAAAVRIAPSRARVRVTPGQ